MLQYKGYYGFKSEDDFNKLVKGLMKLTKEDLIDLAISGKVSGFNKDVDYLLSSIEVDNLLHKTEDLLRESDALIEEQRGCKLPHDYEKWKRISLKVGELNRQIDKNDDRIRKLLGKR